MFSSLIDDSERLAALQRSGLMDSPHEAVFDALTELARDLLGGTAALVSLVDDRRQFFKAQTGLGEPWASARQTPLSHSFCQHVVNTNAPLLVSNAHLDARVEGNGAIHDLGVIAYAGVPLVDGGDHTLGALCVVDGHPREWTQKEVRTLETLAKAVMAEVHLRQLLHQRQQEALERERLLHSLQSTEAALRQALERTRQVMDAAGAGLWNLDATTRILDADARALELMGLSPGGPMTLASGLGSLEPREAAHLSANLEAALRGENGGYCHVEFRTTGGNGLPARWMESRAQAFFDVGGKATHLAGVQLDITSRKLAEVEREEALAAARRAQAEAEAERERLAAVSLQLAEREQLLRLVVEGANMSAWSIDCRTRLVTADERFLELYGLQAREPVPLPAVLDRVHPEDRPRVRRALEAALAGENGGRYDCERRIRGPSGAYHWGETRGQVTFAPDGTPRTMQGVNFDVTVRKEAETLREELLWQTREESERQRLIFEQTPAAIALLEGPEHRFRVANARCRQWVEHQTVLGRTMTEVLPEAAGQGLIALLDTVRRTGEAYVGRESWFQLRRRPEGPLEDVCLDFVYQPIRNTSGQVESIFLHAVEVTELVRSREVARAAVQELELLTGTLRASEKRLDLALDVAGAGTWEVDLSTQEVIADRRFRDMFGLAPEASFSMEKGLAIIHPEDRNRVATAVADAIAGRHGGAYEADYRTVPRADDSYRWVAARGQTFFTPEGKAWRFLGTGLDITARKKVEALVARQSRHHALQAQVGLALSRGGSLPEMLQRCAQALMDQLEVAFTRIWLLSSTSDVLELYASAGIPTHPDGLPGRGPGGQLTGNLLVREERLHLTHSLEGNPWVDDPEWTRREGLMAFAGCPLIVGEKRVGMVALFARHPLSSDTLDTLHQTADTLALGVERMEVEARNAALLARESAARAQAELEQHRLHDIFLQAPAAICVTEGPEHRYVLANPRYLAMVGRRDVVGQTVAQALPEVVEQGFTGLLDTVYRTGVAHVGQETWLRLRLVAEGPLEDVCLSFVHQPVKDASGQTRSIFTHAVDVTELVRARREALLSTEALRINERRLEDALAVSGAGTWEMDVDTNSLTADPRFREMFGLTPEEPFTLAKGLAIIHAEDRERVAALVQSALAGRDQGRFEADYRTVPRPDGSIRWVAARGQTTFDAWGRATRFLGAGTDITARKEAELARMSLLHSLADQPVFGVAVLRGEELRFEAANSAYRQLVGHRDVVGKPLLEALPEFAGQGADTLLHEVLLTGKPFAGREVSYHLVRHGAGDTPEERFFGFVWQPIFDLSGKAESVLVITHDVTDQVRARQQVKHLFDQLAASEERLRRTMEASEVGCWELDVLTGNITADARTAELMGLPSGTVFHLESGLAAMASEDRGRMARAVEAALAGENGGRYFLVFRTGGRDGVPERWVESRAQRLVDEHGRVVAFPGTSLDITARKRAELEREQLFHEVESSRTRLSNLIQNAPFFVCTLHGPQHVYEMFNPPYQQLVGGARALLGLSVQEALPEVVEQGFIRLLDGVYCTGEPFFGREVPIRLDRTGDGRLEETFLDIVYQPRRGVHGQVEGIDVFGFEVTDLVRSRESARQAAQELEVLTQTLRRGEARLALALAVSGTGMWEMDLETGYFSADTRFREMFGLTHEDPFTLEMGLAFVHPEERALVADGVADALAGKNGGAYAAEYRTVRLADGSYRWVSARGQASFNPEGKAVHLAGTGLDVTERKNAELAQARLAQAERQRAEFAQQLIGIVSHDLRNPLGAILMGSLLLQRREGLEPKMLRTLARIQSAAERAERMVRDLLDFTQVRLGGGLKLERQPANLHELARNVVQEVEEAQPGARIRHETRGEGQGAWDEDRLQQVVQNLLTNALKYGTPGEVVDVRTEGHEDGVTLRVHNQGTPIPAERQASIFQPMQRGVAGVDKEGRSVGLGLFIVRAIVEAHGGTIELTSRPGEGTSFQVLLPRETPASMAG